MYSVIVEKSEYVLLENQNEYVVTYGYNPKVRKKKTVGRCRIFSTLEPEIKKNGYVIKCIGIFKN